MSMTILCDVDNHKFYNLCGHLEFDWSRGYIKGSTLTVTTGTSSVIIAILALFISQVGSHSWSIICFLTHQVRSTTRPRNGLYHQQQVILRNSVWGSDLGTIYQLRRVAWFWRGYGMRSIRATTWLIVLGLVHCLYFLLLVHSPLELLLSEMRSSSVVQIVVSGTQTVEAPPILTNNLSTTFTDQRTPNPVGSTFKIARIRHNLHPSATPSRSCEFLSIQRRMLLAHSQRRCAMVL
jgi:hypothetical protein